jgi:hypothetical protein
MGADIDYEGCPLGATLVVAAVCGSLEAVKLLVRRGAALWYLSAYGSTGIMFWTATEAVTRWLLLGQFTKQVKIVAADADSEYQSTERLVVWSGFAQARLKLTGKRRRSPLESSVEYASKLASIRKYWQGKVIPAFD